MIERDFIFSLHHTAGAVLIFSIQALTKKITAKEPSSINKMVEQKTQPKKYKNQQPGFLMPFVNGINGLMNNIWNAIKSLVPMKPQSRAGPI